MTHLIACISAHGLGHLAQTAPVLERLRRHRPGLRLTVASMLPAPQLRARLGDDVRIEARALDVGFEMLDAFRIDRPASARAYRAFDAGWDARLADTTDWLAHERPDLLLANAACLPLAAAARLGIPAFGLGSLNWADLVAGVFAGEPWMPGVHRRMLQAYRSAAAFIVLTPGMAMPDLPRVCRVGPVARLGTARRDALHAQCGAAPGNRIVLVAFGGIDTRLPMARWPASPGLHWLVPGAWRIARPGVTAIEALGWDFGDLIASADALVGKPGYGTFAEAACNGTPMLYAARLGWAEQDALIPWLHRHARARRVDEATLRGGDLAAELEALWRLPVPARPAPDGAEAAAAWLAQACAALRRPAGR